MRVLGRVVTLLAIGLAMVGCKEGFQTVANKEDMMIAAGFKFLPANTAERQAMFRQLPPHKFLKEIKGNKLVYIYPDPTVCVCLYVGNQKAYGAYRKMMFDKNLADEQSMTAQTLDSANWDWGPWGPFGWPYNDSIYYY